MSIDLKKISDLIKSKQADYIDLRIEEAKGCQFYIRGNQVENLNESDEIGFGVRAYIGGKWGFVSGNDLNDLERSVDEAITFAKTIGNDSGKLAKNDTYVDTVGPDMKVDPTEINLNDKIERFLGYYQKLKKVDKRIQDTSVIAYKDGRVIKHFLNSEGSIITQEKGFVGYYCSVVVRDQDQIRQAHTSEQSIKDYQIIDKLEEEIGKTAELALDLLGAKLVKAGKYTVVADQELSGLFIHEAFGHLSEADHLYNDSSLREIMKLGKKFGKKIVNFVDDSSTKEGNGFYKYDDEGVLARKNYLIKDGILVGRLNSRETAGVLNEPLSGNARAISYRFGPIVRMSNTYIEAGNSTFEEMIKDIKLGIYAKGWIGGQTSIENFIFSAAYGYMIRDGKISELVRDVKLSGNVFETIGNIDMIGNDLILSTGFGGCGKEGQSPLLVSDGGPHIRIQDVTIGGE